MAIALTPEFGIEIPDNIKYMDLRERAEAACNTANLLGEHGLDIEPNDEDNDIASTLLASFSKDVTPRKHWLIAVPLPCAQPLSSKLTPSSRNSAK